MTARLQIKSKNFHKITKLQKMYQQTHWMFVTIFLVTVVHKGLMVFHISINITLFVPLEYVFSVLARKKILLYCFDFWAFLLLTNRPLKGRFVRGWIALKIKQLKGFNSKSIEYMILPKRDWKGSRFKYFCVYSNVNYGDSDLHVFVA